MAPESDSLPNTEALRSFPQILRNISEALGMLRKCCATFPRLWECSANVAQHLEFVAQHFPGPKNQKTKESQPWWGLGLVFWFLGCFVFLFFGFLVFWCFGVLVCWCFGVLVFLVHKMALQKMHEINQNTL